MRTKKLLLYISLVFTSLQSFTQVPSNFLGTWEGAYMEINGIDTMRSECYVTFSKTNGNYILGAVKYVNTSDKQTQKSTDIKAYYAYLNEKDQLIYDANTQTKITQRKCKGKMGYLAFTDDKGKRVMRGTFFSDNEIENCNVIRTYLIYKDVSNPYSSVKSKSETNESSSGRVLPQAAILNVGAIDDFKEGYAIYRRGEKFGMIDKNGDEFVPLGKYNFNYTGSNGQFATEQGFHNGMCMVRDVENNKIGYIDLTGKLIVPCTFSVATAYQEDGYSYVEFIDDNYKFYYYFLDKQGHKFPVNSNYRREQTLFFLQSKATDYKTTNFYRKNGTKAFETKLQIHRYGDGMYLTTQWMDNSVIKSGFIDTVGKLVIPYKYAGELKNFSEGLALYEPKYKDEYQYAFINKAGEDEIKLKANSTIERYDDVGDFHNGYAMCNLIYREGIRQLALIDKRGNIIPFEPFFKAANPQLVADTYPNFGISVVPSYFSKAGMIIRCNVRLEDKSITARAFVNSEYRDGRGGVGMAPASWESNGYGMTDYSGKIIILPVFADIHQFDEVSGLAMASYVSRSGQKTDGFINKNGQFTIVFKKNP